jgi:hypothetical protein
VGRLEREHPFNPLRLELWCRVKLEVGGSEDKKNQKALPSCEVNLRGFAAKGFQCNVFLRLLVHAADRLYEILTSFSF